MRREMFQYSMVEPMMLLHLMLGQMVMQYSLPIPGFVRDGMFYPDINPYPFMNAMIETYFEKADSALGIIEEVAYPRPCYDSLAGWGVPEAYWESMCREVFNSINHALLSVLPAYRQDDSTNVRAGLTDTDDLLLCITHYDI
jgi:hypothetical protein